MMIGDKKEKISFADKRKYIRLRSIFPVEFRVVLPEGGEGGGFPSPWQQGYTCNVSEGGICLETVIFNEAMIEQFRRSDAVWELQIRIPLRHPPISAQARLAWVRKVGGGRAPRYLIGLAFCSIAHSDCERMLSQARWFSISTRTVVAAATVLLLGVMISGFYAYQLRTANERLVDNLARLEEEETRMRRMLEEIGLEKKMLAAEGQSGNEYEQLVRRENRIADRLRLLERQKSGMEEVILEKMHEWLKNHQNPLTGLILSFEGEGGVVKDWAFIYDQALAANVFLLFHNERDARRILNFFKQKTVEDFQGFSNAYYYDSGDVAEHTVHCGPNIWVGVAIMQYTKKTGDDYYLPVARKIADWLLSVQEKDPAGGLKGGPSFSWFATEHNLDAYAFFGMMHTLTGEEKYKTAQKRVLSWLKTYALVPHGKDYASPPINRGRGDATIATDTFAWSLAALSPARLRRLGMDPQEIMNFAEEHCAVQVSFRRPSGVVVEVKGFDFAKSIHMPRGGMVSPEWTSQMIVSYQILSEYFSKRKRSIKADYYAQKAGMYLHELNKLIISSPSAKGQGEGCLPYATLEDADTGHGWHTPLGTNTCSIAGTAYMIMAMKQFNPLRLEGKVLGR